MSTPSRAAADALVAAGLVAGSKADAAAAVISSHLPKGSTAYNFTADCEFLSKSITHHVNTYFEQVLHTKAQTYHRRSNEPVGRIILDKEVEEASIELTSLVMNEMGAEYVLYMSKYFGKENSLAAYVFSRIQTLVLHESIAYNNNFLDGLSKRQIRKRTPGELGELPEQQEVKK